MVDPIQLALSCDAHLVRCRDVAASRGSPSHLGVEHRQERLGESRVRSTSSCERTPAPAEEVVLASVHVVQQARGAVRGDARVIQFSRCSSVLTTCSRRARPTSWCPASARSLARSISCLTSSPIRAMGISPISFAIRATDATPSVSIVSEHPNALARFADDVRLAGELALGRTVVVNITVVE